jgi:hypothetical protein
MPAIIAPADYATWFGEEPAEKDGLLALLKPLPAELMRAYPVDRRVGNLKNEDAGLIEPLVLKAGGDDTTAHRPPRFARFTISQADATQIWFSDWLIDPAGPEQALDRLPANTDLPDGSSS